MSTYIGERLTKEDEAKVVGHRCIPIAYHCLRTLADPHPAPAAAHAMVLRRVDILPAMPCPLLSRWMQPAARCSIISADALAGGTY
jgi:hypothetical protein